MLGAPDMMPLHLQLALMRFLGSSGVLPSWSASWPMLEPASPLKAWADLLESQARSEQAQLRRNRRAKQRVKENPSDADELPFTNPLFQATLQSEAFKRTESFLHGVGAVALSNYKRKEVERPVIWKRGNAKLIDYAPRNSNKLAVLAVPSLINRSYILDLAPGVSLLDYLASRGMRPLLLDWDVPGKEEIEYGCSEYVSAMAIEALQALRETHDGPIALLGYCMGGVFTVAMAQLASMMVDALVLLATPWDFSAEDAPNVNLPIATADMLRQFLGNMNPVPPYIINMFFHLIDPWAIQNRYAKFLHLSDEQQQHFLAIEHWLSDGIPLSQRVAIETFVDWPQENTLQKGTLKIGRKWIEPEAVKCPSLAVIPAHDRIVPASCALPITKRLKRCDVLTPSLGHVSMVASERAKETVWQPVADWLLKRF